MSIKRRESDLIGAIYDCVIDHRNWEHVVRRVAEATNSVSAGLYFRHRLDPARVTVQHNMDQSFIDAYSETYSRIDPLAPVAMTINPGEIRNGKAEDGKLTFEVGDDNATMKFVLRREGDKMKGDVSRERDGQVQTAKLAVTRNK